VIEATGSPREAASVLFDLPGYRVLDGVDRPGQLRQVTIIGIAGAAPCPSCGVPSRGGGAPAPPAAAGPCMDVSADGLRTANPGEKPQSAPSSVCAQFKSASASLVSAATSPQRLQSQLLGASSRRAALNPPLAHGPDLHECLCQVSANGESW
jgi:hypothetical protein